MVDLKEYIKSKKEERKKLKEEIKFYSSFKIPLEIIVDKVYSKKDLYSTNYSSATDFEIKKNNICRDSCYGGPDGGYDEYDQQLYPEFYFKMNGQKIYLKNCEKFCIIRRNITKGYGDYKHKSKTGELIYNDKIIPLLKEKGVKSELLNKLEKKIKEIKYLD